MPKVNPFKAFGGQFDPKKLINLYVDKASKINTSNYANGSTNLLSFRRFPEISKRIRADKRVWQGVNCFSMGKTLAKNFICTEVLRPIVLIN